MTTDLPDYYFRIKDSGAAVFRLGNDRRMGRLEMEEIASVNTRTGNLRVHGDAVITEGDRTAIARWVEDRRREIAARDADDARRLPDLLNLTTQWVQARAPDDALDLLTDRLLLSMQDLRAALVRRKAARLDPAGSPHRKDLRGEE